MRALAMDSATRVARADESGRPRLGIPALVVAGSLACCLVGGVWVRLQTIECAYRISAQRQDRTRLIEERRKMELELARLSAPDRIEAIAAGQLGMRFPSQDDVVKLP